MIYLFLAVLALRCCMWALSCLSEQGLRSSIDAQASLCGGFSSGAQAPGHLASVVMVHRMWSQTRDQTSVPCIGRQSLSHETTREAFLSSFWLKQETWSVTYFHVNT